MLRTVREGFGLFAKALRFFGKTLFEGDGVLETTAALHDTTSFLRVLTAGLEFPIPKMPIAGLRFQLVPYSPYVWHDKRFHCAAKRIGLQMNDAEP